MTYCLHDTTRDDLGTIEHPADPNASCRSAPRTPVAYDALASPVVARAEGEGDAPAVDAGAGIVVR